jgi:hypothetical protein
VSCGVTWRRGSTTGTPGPRRFRPDDPGRGSVNCDSRTMHDDRTTSDQVAPGVGSRHVGRRSGGVARLLSEVLAPRLPPAFPLPPPGAPRVPPDRLPRPGGQPPRRGRPAGRPRAGQGPRPLHPPESGRSAARKRGAGALLHRTVARARARGLIPEKPRAAIDATGLETRHVSRSFAWRSNRRRRQCAWPQLTTVLEARSPRFLSAHVSRGPSQDAPQFRPAARAACVRCPVDTLWAMAPSTPSPTMP